MTNTSERTLRATKPSVSVARDAVHVGMHAIDDDQLLRRQKPESDANEAQTTIDAEFVEATDANAMPLMADASAAEHGKTATTTSESASNASDASAGPSTIESTSSSGPSVIAAQAAGVGSLFSQVAPLGAVGGAAAVAVVASGGGSGGGADAADSAVTGTIVAGPVIAGNDLVVSVYRADGVTLVGTGTVDAGGAYKVDLGGYTGPVIARVTSATTAGTPDYLDEATGTAVNLQAVLTAVGVATASGLSLSLNPLTTIAAQLAGLSADGTGSVADAASVEQANTAVALAFGIRGSLIAPEALAPVVNADGTPNSAADYYGKVLASLSGLDERNGGSMQTTLANFVNDLKADGSLSGESKLMLVLGAQDAEVAATTLGDIGRELAAMTAITAEELRTALLADSSKLTVTELALAVGPVLGLRSVTAEALLGLRAQLERDVPGSLDQIGSALKNLEETGVLALNAGVNWSYPVDRTPFEQLTPPLTVQASLANGDPLPAWMTFDEATLNLTGTPPSDGLGLYEIVLKASDAVGNGAGLQLNVAVVELDNTFNFTLSGGELTVSGVDALGGELTPTVSGTTYAGAPTMRDVANIVLDNGGLPGDGIELSLRNFSTINFDVVSDTAIDFISTYRGDNPYQSQTINIVANADFTVGTGRDYTFDTADDAPTTIKVSGTGNVDLGNIDGNWANETRDEHGWYYWDGIHVDASELTGDLRVLVTAGNNTIVGGSGDDWIAVTGGGYLKLTGGAGADTFELRADAGFSGLDVITDFELGVDKLDLSQVTDAAFTVGQVTGALASGDAFASGVDVATLVADGGTYVYVDANHDGLFQVNDDAKLFLDGVTAPLDVAFIHA